MASLLQSSLPQSSPLPICVRSLAGLLVIPTGGAEYAAPSKLFRTRFLRVFRLGLPWCQADPAWNGLTEAPKSPADALLEDRKRAKIRDLKNEQGRICKRPHALAQELTDESLVSLS